MLLSEQVSHVTYDKWETDTAPTVVFCRPHLLLSELVTHVTVPEGTAVSAGQLLKKTWELRNCGASAWPKSTKVSVLEVWLVILNCHHVAEIT